MIEEKTILEHFKIWYKFLYLDSPKRDFEKETQVSNDIRTLMKMIYPPGKDRFDHIHFSLSKDIPEPPFFIRAISNKDMDFAPFTVSISTEMLVPLKIESALCAIENKTGADRINRFSTFLQTFDPDSVHNPPEKQQLKILFQWFVKNVDHTIKIKYDQKKNEHSRILAWLDIETKRHKRIVVPENVTLKEMAYSILVTGSLKNMKKKKPAEIERT